MKFEISWNLLPVLKIVTCTAHTARHKPVLLSTGARILFLVLELYTLTQIACFYVLSKKEKDICET